MERLRIHRLQRLAGGLTMKFFGALTFLGGLLGAAVLMITLTNSSGAPQEAAGAAIAVALVAIPYCMGRAVHMWGESRRLRIPEDILTEIRQHRERDLRHGIE